MSSNLRESRIANPVLKVGFLCLIDDELLEISEWVKSAYVTRSDSLKVKTGPPNGVARFPGTGVKYGSVVVGDGFLGLSRWASSEKGRGNHQQREDSDKFFHGQLLF
jgi:hypothetical protein